jgi:hypothetical protein
MKFILLFGLGLVLMSCKSDQTMMQTIQDHVESYLKSKGHDVSSYEFVGLTPPDTVTVKEYIDREMEGLTLSLMNKLDRIKMMDSVEVELRKTLKSNPTDSTATTNLKDIGTTRATLIKQQHALDSLTAVIKPEMSQTIKFIATEYSFNKKNPDGTTSLHKYFIKLDENLNVTDVTELIN